VKVIAVSAGDVVVTQDASNTVMAYALEGGQDDQLTVTEKLMKTRFEEPAQQLLLNEAGDRLLISTATADQLWVRSVNNGFQQTKVLESSPRSIWKWMSSIRIPDTLILVVDETIRRFSWETLDELATTGPPRKIDIGTTVLTGTDLTLKALATDISGSNLVAEFAHKLGSKATERLAVWRADAIESQSEGASTEPTLLLSSAIIKHFLGTFEHSIVFLDHHLWVCSIDLASLSLTRGDDVKELVKKHFFIPLEFLGGNEGNMGSLSRKGDVVFPKEGEVAVARDGLKWSL